MGHTWPHLFLFVVMSLYHMQISGSSASYFYIQYCIHKYSVTSAGMVIQWINAVSPPPPVQIPLNFLPVAHRSLNNRNGW